MHKGEDNSLEKALHFSEVESSICSIMAVHAAKVYVTIHVSINDAKPLPSPSVTNSLFG